MARFRSLIATDAQPALRLAPRRFIGYRVQTTNLAAPPAQEATTTPNRRLARLPRFTAPTRPHHPPGPRA